MNPLIAVSRPLGVQKKVGQGHQIGNVVQKNVMQFKIMLNDSVPKVWRRIVVPNNFSFFDLYCAIQDAMGWSDAHLHSFYVVQKETYRFISIQLPSPDYSFDNGDLDERKEKIADYFGKKIKQCQYTYDFGDGWDHTILLENEYEGNAKTKYPICIAGADACPIEDCGGVGGYDRLIKILKNPKHREYKEMCEWLEIKSGEEFDWAKFDLSEIIFSDPLEREQEWQERF